MSAAADKPLEARIRAVLDEIQDPCSVAAGVPIGLSSMGIVRDVEVDPDGQVEVTFRLTSPFCEMLAFMRQETIAKVSDLPGVSGVTVAHDSGLDWDESLISPEAQDRRRDRLAQMERSLARSRGRRVVHGPR